MSEKQRDAQLEQYKNDLEAACAKALAGALSRRQLESELYALAKRNITIMFLLGGGDLDMRGAKAWLARQLKIHRGSAKKLARDVFAGRYSVGDS